MNWVGYQLLGKKRFDEAIEILKLNAETFPDSSNVYDSLGEAYLKSGETQLSIKNYRKAVELNPQNANAVNAVKQLESAQQVKTDAKLLETYAGEYETPFGVFKVVKEGERLVGRVAGEADMILLPQSDAHFVVALGSIRLTFVKDEKGVVTHANISVKGQEISAKKIR
jgi:tetratricopeptide (TPR) repeat protein